MTEQRPRLRLLIAYAILAAPLVVYGAVRATEGNSNSPIDWVTSQFAPRADYDAFCELFGPGDVVVMSWPGATIDEPRLDQLTRVIRSARVFHDAAGGWLFERVVSGREAITQLTRPLGSGLPALSEADAAQRLRSHLVGPDGKTTAVVVTFNARGLRDRARLVGLLRQAAADMCGAPREQIHMAGPVVDGLSVDQASQATLSKYAAPSALVVFVLCWCHLRSMRAAVVVFGLAAFCQAATLALVHYSGDSMNALLIVLPPLIQVLAVAGGVHLTNYYFDACTRLDPQASAQEALCRGWLPCTLSIATTAIGMASLAASQLSPVQSFGAYAALGVLLSGGVLLGLLPACYTFWPPRQDKRPGTESPPRELDSQRWPASWARVLQAQKASVSLVGLLAVAVGGWYAAQVSTSVRIETLFGRESRVIQDYQWLETHVGALAPFEITLTFQESSPLAYRDKLTLLWKLGDRLRSCPEFSSPFSAAGSLPSLEPLRSLAVADQARLIEQLATGSLATFQELGLLSRNDEAEHWRLTVKTSALGAADYGAMLTDVRAMVDREIAELPPALTVGLTSNTTGIMPLVHEIQGQLLADLLKSFAGALVLITIVMTVVQGGVLPGLLAMVPNVFPIALFFGWLGWRGEAIDIGVVMTASVALGIAVDDTLHFLTFFQRGQAQQLDRRSSVEYALGHCGPAMIQTTISCGLGLLVFALSDFLPTSRFATSMAALLVLALAGDLILLPALLLSPLGALFTKPQSDPAERHGDRQNVPSREVKSPPPAYAKAG